MIALRPHFCKGLLRASTSARIRSSCIPRLSAPTVSSQKKMSRVSESQSWRYIKCPLIFLIAMLQSLLQLCWNYLIGFVRSAIQRSLFLLYSSGNWPRSVMLN